MEKLRFRLINDRYAPYLGRYGCTLRVGAKGKVFLGNIISGHTIRKCKTIGMTLFKAIMKHGSRRSQTNGKN